MSNFLPLSLPQCHKYGYQNRERGERERGGEEGREGEREREGGRKGG